MTDKKEKPHADALQPTPREIANELCSFENRALNNYHSHVGSLELALELRVAINRILGRIPFEAAASRPAPAPGRDEDLRYILQSLVATAPEDCGNEACGCKNYKAALAKARAALAATSSKKEKK